MSRKPDTHMDEIVLEAVRAGEPVSALAKRLGVSTAAVYQRLSRAAPDWRSTVPGTPRGRLRKNDRVVSLEAVESDPTPAVQPDPTAPPIESDRWLLSPGEAADLFAVDPKTITRWAKNGKLSFVTTLGGHRRYPKSEIERLFAEGSARRNG